MAYVCDADQARFAQPLAPRRAGVLETVAALPRRALDWLAAWDEAAEEAAAGRAVYGNCGGKITDGLEREMMRRLSRE